MISYTALNIIFFVVIVQRWYSWPSASLKPFVDHTLSKDKSLRRQTEVLNYFRYRVLT